MCSIGEDDFGDEGGVHAMLKDDQIPITSERCSKCEAKGVLIKLKSREAECSDCFLAYTRHKFRATLGSSKILPKGAEVLLLFDGSAESTVLLDMMHFARSQNNFKRLHVTTKVLFIDESSFNNRIDICYARDLLNKYGFETFIISLEDKSSLHKMEEFDKYSNSKSNQLDEKLSAIKTLTSRQEFLKVWKTKIIEMVANQLTCNFVFLPDISTNLATELLNSISLGRGASAALEVSLLDDRLTNLKLLRPLRNLNSNEVEFYMQVNNIKPIKTVSYGETNGSSASIQNLTKAFVKNLQDNFSSTVSTVFRTGDKIASNNLNVTKSIIEEIKCSFCNSQINIKPSNTLLAIEFSRLASASSGNMKDFEVKLSAKENMFLQNKAVCHACENIRNDSENIFL